ncbi:MAG: terminase small subunit [Wohlfahrtiimonas sp.]
MILTTEQFADFIGVTTKTVNKWITYGMPVLRKGGQGRGNESAIESISAIDWVIEQKIAKTTGGTPKDQLDKKRAELIEIQIQKESDNLVEADFVEQLYGGLLTQLRIEMQFVGDEITMMIKNEFNIDVKRDDIQNKIVEALQRVYEKSTDEELLDEEFTREDQEEFD